MDSSRGWTFCVEEQHRWSPQGGERHVESCNQSSMARLGQSGLGRSFTNVEIDNGSSVWPNDLEAPNARRWDEDKQGSGYRWRKGQGKNCFIYTFLCCHLYIYLSRTNISFLLPAIYLPFVQGACSPTWMGGWKWGRGRQHVFHRREGTRKRRSLKTQEWGESVGGRVRWETESSNPPHDASGPCRLLGTELAGKSCQRGEPCQLFNGLQLWNTGMIAGTCQGGSGEAAIQIGDRLVELFDENLIDLSLLPSFSWARGHPLSLLLGKLISVAVDGQSMSWGRGGGGSVPCRRKSFHFFHLLLTADPKDSFWDVLVLQTEGGEPGIQHFCSC